MHKCFFAFTVLLTGRPCYPAMRRCVASSFPGFPYPWEHYMKETPGFYEKGMIAILSSDLMQACEEDHGTDDRALSQSADLVAGMRCS